MRQEVTMRGGQGQPPTLAPAFPPARWPSAPFAWNGVEQEGLVVSSSPSL